MKREPETNESISGTDVGDSSEKVPCQEVAAHLPLYADGELDPIRAHRVGDHLSTCVSCRDRQRQLLEERLWLTEVALDAPRLSDRFPSKVMERVSKHLARERRQRRWRRATAAVFSAAAILVLAMVAYRLDGILELAPFAAAPTAPSRAPVSPAPGEDGEADPFFRVATYGSHRFDESADDERMAELLAWPLEDSTIPCANIDWVEPKSGVADDVFTEASLADPSTNPASRSEHDKFGRILRVSVFLGYPIDDLRMRRQAFTDRKGRLCHLDGNAVARLCQELLLSQDPPQGLASHDQSDEDREHEASCVEV